MSIFVMAKRNYLALLAIMLLAFALRVYRLDGQSLWYDEAVTAQVASQGISELTRWTADDIQPPLYYYAAAGWLRVAGRGEWALRFPSAFFGTLTAPLMWAVALRLFGRGRSGRAAALAAALLAALSPLYVYYAQEARMYTLLTFLGLLAGYALLRATADGGWRPKDEGRQTKDEGRTTEHRHDVSSFVFRLSSVKWWFLFVIASAALLYTHYFGVFLLLAYGVCFAIGWLIALARGRPCWRMLAAFAVACLGIALLYLPWLPAMLNRYALDRSYWQGALKVNEALRHVAVSFTTGAPETMLERDAVRLLPWFGVALVVAAGALVWQGSALRGAEDRRRGGAGSVLGLVYLSTCLLVPLLAVLLLASRTPKFNPRYLMLVSPAYLLILAGGIGALAGGSMRGSRGAEGQRGGGAGEHGSRSMQHVARSTLAVILSAFLIAVSVIGLRNWFTDPAFTKAQWRELAAAVRAQIAPDEAVLLVSGHASPAWDYYAPDISRTRLPDIDILDVDAVLGFDAGAQLGRALAGKAGAWLVSWQDAVVDPAGFVPHFLDRAGAERPVPQKFWHLGLRHWWLRPDAAFPAEASPAHVEHANFDHKLALLGWDDPREDQLTVYWRVLNTLPQDYRVSVILEDAQGREVGRWDGRPASYDYPTTRWQPGQEIFGRYPLPLPPDAPAGDYSVTLAVYDESHPDGLDVRDAADNPAGKRARLGPLRVEH
jgi:mannosyltransferase